MDLEQSRLYLDKILRGIVPNVYYQPPEKLKLNYPAIVYSRKPTRTKSANNRTYIKRPVYQVTLIDPEPDSSYINSLLDSFAIISHDNTFATSGLNHDVFTIIFGGVSDGYI